MSPPPRRWSTGELLAYALLLASGVAATLAFPPLLGLYAAGYLAWAAYYYATKDRQ